MMPRASLSLRGLLFGVALALSMWAVILGGWSVAFGQSVAPSCLESLQAASLHVGYLERYRGAEERDFAATHAALLREIERLKAAVDAAKPLTAPSPVTP